MLQTNQAFQQFTSTRGVIILQIIALMDALSTMHSSNMLKNKFLFFCSPRLLSCIANRVTKDLMPLVRTQVRKQLLSAKANSLKQSSLPSLTPWNHLADRFLLWQKDQIMFFPWNKSCMFTIVLTLPVRMLHYWLSRNTQSIFSKNFHLSTSMKMTFSFKPSHGRHPKCFHHCFTTSTITYWR